MKPTDSQPRIGRPLVSFCLLCFNQRRFIGAALEGAFAQTYRPLEIVISDDGSTDGSAEFIREQVAFRAPPDVDVVFNRNSTNLGIYGNWLKAASLSHGELLVKADGDDVSLPERAERIADAWLADGKRAVAIGHAGFRIDPEGRPLGAISAPGVKVPLGALMAWRRDCYSAFPSEAVHPRCVEDVPFAKRSMMLGEELVIPDRLVRYRIGSGISSTLYRHRAPVASSWRHFLSAMDEADRDLAAIAPRLPPGRAEELRRKFASDRAYGENHLALVESPSFRARWMAFARERRTGYWNSRVFTYAYLLPRPFGDFVLDGITTLNQLRRRLLNWRRM